MAEIDPAVLEAARKLVAEYDGTQKGLARTSQNERLDQLLEMALTRMSGDIDLAANLFQRWAEQDSQVRDLFQPLIREAIEARLAKLPHAEPKIA